MKQLSGIQMFSVTSLIGVAMLVPVNEAVAGGIQISYHSDGWHYKSHGKHYKRGKHGHKHKHKQRHKRHHHRTHHYHRPYEPFGYVKFGLPFGRVTLRVGGKVYYYHDGYYYRRHTPHGYVTVPAPYGACVARLPWGYKTHYHHGERFFEARGVYYKHTPEGYVVISDPRYAAVGPSYVPSNVYGQSFTVNVPNNQGGYSAVELIEKGEGYIGPQGEYYEEFPDIKQLSLLYGK